MGSWDPPGILEEVPGGLQQKRGSFIFLIIPSISNTVTERMSTWVTGFYTLKHLKANILSDEVYFVSRVRKGRQGVRSKKADEITSNMFLVIAGLMGQKTRGVVHLKAIEADDTVSMRNIALSQDFFCFLEEEKKQENRP